MNKIQLSDEQIKNAYDENFGCFVDSLYYWGEELSEKNWDKKISYEKNAEIFLAVFKGLIDKGLILAITPDCFYDKKTKTYNTTIKKIAREKDAFWDVSSDEMIEYIRSVFPDNLRWLRGGKDSDDEIYAQFWYIDCPGIRWVDKETGEIY
ncbi:MAG: hypothetical protein K5978_02165 [Campylobacter sp.]|nr:hypothetical protein [Campylobacter sp.]